MDIADFPVGTRVQVRLDNPLCGKMATAHVYGWEPTVGTDIQVSLERHLNEVAANGWRLVTVQTLGKNDRGKTIWMCFWERKDW